MQQKTATTQVKINDLIAKRWSPRAFDANKLVTNEDLTALIEAARWAPSCFNDQPWRFIIANKATDSAGWEQALDVIVEKNRLWAINAPVLILSVAMNNFNHNGKPNRWAIYDAGAASMSLCLQATALGLIVHQMGGFDVEKAVQTFTLPEDCTPIAMMAVGYQAEADELHEEFQAAEMAERTRAELALRFYAGKWGSEWQ